MALSTVIEVVIGLSFLYAVLSLVASGANELVSSMLALRARTLEHGIQHLLVDPAEAKTLYDHPIVQSLYRAPRLPSYIPPDKFALALLDTKVKPAVGAVSGAADQVANITDAIHQLPPGRIKDTLDVLWREAKHDADAFRKNVENWFDDTMERVSGWYRRLVQLILIFIGLVIAVGLNVNTITVAQRLWTDAPLRAAVVQQAQKAVPPSSTDKQSVKDALDNVQSGLQGINGLSLPIGWGNNAQPSTWYGAAAGWVLTALAISMGAPFWFDLLGKVARLRSSGVRPDTAVPQSAESQPPGGPVGAH